eukprot:363670-Chlamydomonas_euryale.AAC.4
MMTRQVLESNLEWHAFALSHRHLQFPRRHRTPRCCSCCTPSGVKMYVRGVSRSANRRGAASVHSHAACTLGPRQATSHAHRSRKFTDRGAFEEFEFETAYIHKMVFPAAAHAVSGRADAGHGSGRPPHQVKREPRHRGRRPGAPGQGSENVPCIILKFRAEHSGCACQRSASSG